MNVLLPVDDIVSRTVLAALDGVAQRQRVIADNIANASTPGYRAQEVKFESALAAALSQGSPESAAASVVDAGTPVKQDGNSVDMTREVLKMDESGLMFEALVNAMSFKISTVRAALSR